MSNVLILTIITSAVITLVCLSAAAYELIKENASFDLRRTERNALIIVAIISALSYASMNVTAIVSSSLVTLVALAWVTRQAFKRI